MSKQKSTIYQCDNDECQEKFFEADQVFDIKGMVTDGEGEGVLLDKGMYCPECLLKFLFVDGDILDPIIELSETLQDEMAAKEEKENEEEEYDVESKLLGDEDWDDE